MLDYVIIGMLGLAVILLVVLLFKKGNSTLNEVDIARINKAIDESNRIIDVKFNSIKEIIDLKNDAMLKEILSMSDKMDKTINMLNLKLEEITKNNFEGYNKIKEQLAIEIREFNKQFKEALKDFDNSIKEKIVEFNKSTNESLGRMNETVNSNLKSIREDNNEKLDKINVTVGEKLEKTLEGRLKQSFDSVIEQIGGVNKAIGEIKGLASDVGSLKTVLTNVKTKGIVGEVILGNIIGEILTTDQYEENVVTKKGSSDRVEFAIKMPGNEDEFIYLPIDSKLPLEGYHKIKDGMDRGDSEAIKEGRKELRGSIRKYAKDISEKYIDVPNTCDFAIMFLPIEGLYIEALNMGLFEEIQRDYRVNIAGPTTLTAILNALQMGFKTLVIQKKSADVFKLLGAVKTEFEKFASTLEKTQKKVTEASDELDKLVGTRTRMIQSKLKSIQRLDVDEANNLITDGE